MLSVDVEALEMRSRTAPLDRLIWGRFPEGDFGLERMMSIAEACGAPLAMFLDYPEFYAYGDALLDVGREILKRGHDLNLHLHLDCIPPGYFSKRNLPEGCNLNTLGDEGAYALVSDVVELHGRVTSSAASALRGGAYRYNGALLRALGAAGVPISSNYNQAAKLQPFDLGPRRQFRWETGTIELPVATQAGFHNRTYATHFNFNIAPLIAVDEATALANSAAFLDRFYRQHGDDAVAVFVMHSWSFLCLDAGGQFSAVNVGASERLAALLSAWSKWAEFVTPRDVLALSQQGSLPLDGPFPIASSPVPTFVETAAITPAVSAAQAVAESHASDGLNDLETLKQRVSALEREVQRQRQIAAGLETQLEKAQNTLSFRLGYLLLHAPKSWAGMRRLPRDLWALHRDAKLRRAGQRPRRDATAFAAPEAGSVRAEQVAEEAMRVLLADGMSAALDYVETGAENQRDRAFALTRVSKSLRASDPAAAATLAQRAYELEPQPQRAKWLAFLKFSCGELSSPAVLLATLPDDFLLKPTEHERVAEIRGLANVRAKLPQIPARAARVAYQPLPRRCLYLTASAQPFHVSGYTVRTHALVQAIRAGGFDVIAALRPGYPGDRGIRVTQSSHELDGVTYHHVRGPHFRQTPLDRYFEEAAVGLVELARRTRPQLIHAASNHVNALPALLAARRLGVPFVYEVRGMWELTAATRNQDWERTERFGLERDLEAIVAREADLVLTLTSGLADDLASRGVARERLAIVPNSVDPSLFAPRPKDVELQRRYGLGPDAFTLVYAGALLGYEGLDDALRAIAVLVHAGVDAHFVIAGDGEARDALRYLAIELGIEQRVKLLGKIPPDEIPKLWSIGDAAAFPRKPFKVCELVSPLKPLEPMTMGVPVVVSSVAALREMVQDGETGLVHRAGDFEDLASKLIELQRSPAKRHALGQAAREAVLRDRTWQAAGETVVELYGRMTGDDGRVRSEALQQLEPLGA